MMSPKSRMPLRCHLMIWQRQKRYQKYLSNRNHNLSSRSQSLKSLSYKKRKNLKSMLNPKQLTRTSSIQCSKSWLSLPMTRMQQSHAPSGMSMPKLAKPSMLQMNQRTKLPKKRRYRLNRTRSSLMESLKKKSMILIDLLTNSNKSSTRRIKNLMNKPRWMSMHRNLFLIQISHPLRKFEIEQYLETILKY